MLAMANGRHPARNVHRRRAAFFHRVLRLLQLLRAKTSLTAGSFDIGQQIIDAENRNKP